MVSEPNAYLISWLLSKYISIYGVLITTRPAILNMEVGTESLGRQHSCVKISDNALLEGLLGHCA